MLLMERTEQYFSHFKVKKNDKATKTVSEAIVSIEDKMLQMIKRVVNPTEKCVLIEYTRAGTDNPTYVKVPDADGIKKTRFYISKKVCLYLK